MLHDSSRFDFVFERHGLSSPCLFDLCDADCEQTLANKCGGYNAASSGMVMLSAKGDPVYTIPVVGGVIHVGPASCLNRASSVSPSPIVEGCAVVPGGCRILQRLHSIMIQTFGGAIPHTKGGGCCAHVKINRAGFIRQGLNGSKG